MRAILIGAVLVGLAAVAVQAETVRIMADRESGGVIVAVDPVQAWHGLVAWNRARTVERDVYVEYVRRPRAGDQFVDATVMGTPDTPPVVIDANAKTNETEGIFVSVGKSISRNPWSWAAGGLAAAGGLYAIGENNNWFSSKGGDDAPATPSIAVQQSGNGTVSIVIQQDNSSPASSSTGQTPVIVPTK